MVTTTKIKTMAIKPPYNGRSHSLEIIDIILKPLLIYLKGPGLIGIFGLRFSEKLQFPVLFGLYSHHKGNMT